MFPCKSSSPNAALLAAFLSFAITGAITGCSGGDADPGAGAGGNAGAGGTAGSGGDGGVGGGGMGGAGGTGHTDPVVSDDFDAESLDTDVWEVVDPIGDGTVELVGVGTPDAHLMLTVPGGTAHNAWIPNNDTLRLMQPAPDEDFELEAKFESLPTENLQYQGLIVEQGPGMYIRFDAYSDGASLNIFAATFDEEGATTRLNEPIASAPVIWMRLARSGDDWTGSYSFDGETWTTAMNFNSALQVSSVGVYAGNFDPSPEYTAVVDYFFNNAARIDPEDTPLCDPGETFTVTVDTTGPGMVTRSPDKSVYDCRDKVTLTAQPDFGSLFLGWGGDLSGTTSPVSLTIEVDTNVSASFEADTFAPVVSNEKLLRFETSADVSWDSDEMSTGFVEYGLTNSYEIGSVASSTLATQHSVTLPSLTAGTTYFYRIVAEDDFDNRATGDEETFATVKSGPGGPTIDIWYGLSQTFGAAGVPQRFANILGNAADEMNGLSYLAYSLNGGPELPLSIGFDDTRLANIGDFNVEVEFEGLPPGENTVTIRAIDGDDFWSTATVTLDYVDDVTASLPYSIDWSTVNEISEVAQIVDGKWRLDPDGLRTVETGYDRLVGIGDISWTNYEATAEITLHEKAPNIGAPIVGLLMRWTGHHEWDDSQPRIGWYPMGALLAYAWQPDNYVGLMAWTSNGSTTEATSMTPEPGIGVPHMYKMRSEELGNGDIQYRMKVWPSSEAEPSAWGHTYVSSISPPSGSLIIVAHNSDITIGDVEIVEVTD